MWNLIVLADMKLGGDLRVSEAVSQEIQDLALARCQRLGELLDGDGGVRQQPLE